MKLRENIKNNLNSAEKRFGFLNHPGRDYYGIIPIINAKKFKDLLEEDRSVWRTFYHTAKEKAQKVAD